MYQENSADLLEQWEEHMKVLREMETMCRQEAYTERMEV